MTRKRNVDLTQGSIAGQILLFAIPILLGDLFQNFYNSVDSLVVGNYVGKEALAAVNACSPITNLLVNFFVGMSAGTGVIFGRNFGARTYKRLQDSIHREQLNTILDALRNDREKGWLMHSDGTYTRREDGSGMP